ncbi:gas vesicle protein [Natroniella sulfidigena]|uniref:gas vesicle protein GvpJ n=1 Tax=Natroniella sulfidigena TaxID=723921 RepID=UPI00200A7429|nr:gas vesicle protein GvpJ [Natroniella sulfidigena]MCK8817050.1 gas vesicle protein [Natroniella sulfidigena]
MSELDLQQEVTLLDLLDRLLNKGIVLSGDLVLTVADIDLLYVGLRVLITSVENLEGLQRGGQDDL